MRRKTYAYRLPPTAYRLPPTAYRLPPLADARRGSVTRLIAVCSARDRCRRLVQQSDRPALCARDTALVGRCPRRARPTPYHAPGHARRHAAVAVAYYRCCPAGFGLGYACGGGRPVCGGVRYGDGRVRSRHDDVEPLLLALLGTSGAGRYSLDHLIDCRARRAVRLHPDMSHVVIVGAGFGGMAARRGYAMNRRASR